MDEEAGLRPVEYLFSIDAFTPDSIPMERLAKYLTALSKLYGHTERTHFTGISEGSAVLHAAIEPTEAPKVEARLNDIRLGSGTKDAMAAKQELEDLLANDNAVGALTMAGSGHVVLPFIGRNRPKPLILPPFREDTSVDGVLVSIGGKDKSSHAILEDGNLSHTGITMSRDMARDLAPLLYGPTIRLFGNGRFERRANGDWKMTEFKVSRYEQLDGKPISEILTAIRAIKDNGLMHEDAYHNVSRLQSDGEDGE